MLGLRVFCASGSVTVGIRRIHGRSGHFVVLNRKVNRAFFLVLVCFTFICCPGKEISGIILGICKNVDELAINSNAVIFGFFVMLMHSMLSGEEKM